MRYEVQSPGSPWDEDGDGWVGPYSDEDVPENVRAALSPGAQVTSEEGQLEASLSPPSVLLVFGVFGGLLFAAWSFVGPSMERRFLQEAQADPIRLIEMMVRKTRNSSIVAASLLGAMGGGLAGVGLILEARTWEKVFIIGLGAVALLAAAVAALSAWKLRDPKRSPLMRVVLEEPHRIVWVFASAHEVNGVANHFVSLCLDDGTRHDFAIRQLEPEPLLGALAERLPHAAFGHTPERQAAFDSSPATFARTA